MHFAGLDFETDAAQRLTPPNRLVMPLTITSEVSIPGSAVPEPDNSKLSSH